MSRNLLHYSTKREPMRFVDFWGNRGLDEQSEANQGELMCRADMLMDGIVMLVPTNTEAQQLLIREAILRLKQAMSVVHGAFVLEEKRS